MPAAAHVPRLNFGRCLEPVGDLVLHGPDNFTADNTLALMADARRGGFPVMIGEVSDAQAWSRFSAAKQSAGERHTRG